MANQLQQIHSVFEPNRAYLKLRQLKLSEAFKVVILNTVSYLIGPVAAYTLRL